MIYLDNAASGRYKPPCVINAVNYALRLSEEGKKVSLSDLDIVNPYFRSKDSEKILNDAGIRFISSEYANSNVDMPALPADAYSVTADKERFAVVDVGGDDRGALALGRYVPDILAENDYEMLFVINKYRPLTRDAKSAVEVMREIEDAAKMRFTAIINNSNIGELTKAQDVLSSVAYANEVAQMTGLPVRMTSVHFDLEKELAGKIENLFPIKLYIRQTWKAE
jgi:hypothetical protein